MSTLTIFKTNKIEYPPKTFAVQLQETVKRACNYQDLSTIIKLVLKESVDPIFDSPERIKKVRGLV